MLGLQQIFGKETIVGLDIGSRFIKVALAEPGSGADDWRIVKAAIVSTPHDSIRDGAIVDIPTMARTIRDLLRSADISATGAAVAISGSSVIVRHVKLPKMAESLLRKGIRYEAKQYISSSTEDSAIEFEITGDVPDEPDKMGVMLVAVPNDMVESRVSTIVAAGLEPIAIDVEAFALQRALLDVSPIRRVDDQTVALLDIGALSTDVNIITNGKFALTRNIGIAGDSFTNAIKTVSHKSEWADIEAVKHETNMSVLLESSSNAEELALAQALQPTVDELLREVKRSINYYQSQLADANSNLPPGIAGSDGGVSKIVISGGCARMAGLAKYMAARLGMEVEAWNVFDNPNLDCSRLPDELKEADYHVFGTCIGLALKEYSEHPSIRRPAPRRAAAKAA